MVTDASAANTASEAQSDDKATGSIIPAVKHDKPESRADNEVAGNTSASISSPATLTFSAAEQAEIDRFLGEYGNDPKAVSTVTTGLHREEGVTMLHNAARYGTPAVAKYLVSQGVSIHARTSKRLTPLLCAIIEKNDEVAKYLRTCPEITFTTAR